MKAIFVGNPNSGKTTIFNSAAKASEHVANWHGVTVKVAQKSIKYAGDKLTFFDLPGLYSLSTKSREEEIAIDFLKGNKDATIFNICAYETLERSLFLTYELKKAGYNIVLVINTMGGSYSQAQLTLLRKKLGIDIIQLDARKNGKKIKEFMAKQPKTPTANPSQNLYYSDYKTFLSVFPVVVLKDNQKIDRFLLNKTFGFIIFVVVLSVVFWITFGVIGSYLSKWLTSFLLLICGKLQVIIEASSWFWLSDLFEMVVMKGFIGVMSFLPQLVLLLSLLWCFEEIGYLPRIAYIFNDFLSKYKLSGRSTLSLIMGVGCTTTAIMTARNMENLAIRRRTTTLLPFISCSAKLPVFVCISSMFFSKYKVVVSLLLYLMGIGFGLLALRIIPAEKKSSPYIMELPSLKLPSAKRVLGEALKTTKEFLVRVGGIVALVSAMIWFFQNFNFRFEYVGYASESNMLFAISKYIAVLFIPLGFGNWQTVVALITGFIAKESIVVSLFILGAEQLFTFNSAISFLIFVLLYSPCVSAISALKREFGIKRAVWVAVYHTLLAYAVSLVVYTFLMVFNMPVLLGAAAVVIVLVNILKLFRKKNCNNCRICYK